MFLVQLLFLYVPAVFGYSTFFAVLLAYFKKRKIQRKLEGVLKNVKKEKKD